MSHLDNYPYIKERKYCEGTFLLKAVEIGQQTLPEYESKRIFATVGVPVMKAVGLKSIYADIC